MRSSSWSRSRTGISTRHSERAHLGQPEIGVKAERDRHGDIPVARIEVAISSALAERVTSIRISWGNGKAAISAASAAKSKPAARTAVSPAAS